MVVETVATAAILGVTLLVAHDVADHVLGQTDYHAANKMKPGKEGYRALMGHVLSYHGVMMIIAGAVIILFNLPVSFLGFGLAMFFSAATHAFLDRRWPVKRLLQMTGSPNFAEMQTPICGMYQADQSLHKLALLITVMIAVFV